MTMNNPQPGKLDELYTDKDSPYGGEEFTGQEQPAYRAAGRVEASMKSARGRRCF